MTNPFTLVINSYHDDEFQRSYQEPIMLALKIMEDSYTSGYTVGTNPWRYVVQQLSQYGPNQMLDDAIASWQPQLTKN